MSGTTCGTASDSMSKNAEELFGNLDRYLNWNLSLFHLEQNKNILELGCGVGMYYKSIMSLSPRLHLAMDFDLKFLEKMKEVAKGNARCRIKQGDLLDSSLPDKLSEYEFDYVLLFDVLEHIEDHESALNNINRILRCTGNPTLCIRVPALNAINGENDRAIGHYRRYSKRGLRKLLEKCSFEIKYLSYQNLPGILPWLINGKILKRSVAVRKQEGMLFNLAVPLIRSLENIIEPPLGLSLYCRCKSSDSAI